MITPNSVSGPWGAQRTWPGQGSSPANTWHPPFNPASDEPTVELLDIIPYEELLRHVQLHPYGPEALYGQDVSPDWDALLDCGHEPADPDGRTRWQITREAYEAIKPFLKSREDHLRRYKKARAYQSCLGVLRRNDPLYQRTMHVMEYYLGKLPHVLKKLVMPALAREFGEFAELYRHLRQAATLVENHEHHRRRTAKHAQAAKHQGEIAPTDADQAELLALVKRVRAGGAREGDLLRYLELTQAGR